MRFRTRLTITLSLMTGISLVIMAAIIFTIALGRMTFNYLERGRVLNQVAQSNIEYGLELPERVLEAVGNQMIVSALLAAELVALAEEAPGALEPDQISARLQRVIDRSVAWQGRPLVDEFWITDETGSAYIHTSGEEAFVFPPSGASDSQASRFSSLLEPDASPVFQPIMPRDSDSKPFSYAGVGGVDKPRIVQLGIGGDYFEHLREEFTAEEIMSRFFVETGVDRIAIVNMDGSVEAAVGEPFLARQPIVDEDVRQQCLAFLSRASEQELRRGASVTDYNNDAGEVGVGVVTRLRDARGGPDRALFIQHQVAPVTELIGQSLTVISTAWLTIVLIAILVGMYLSRRLTKPLADLADAAEAFGGGDLNRRVSVKGDREVQALADTFNSMAESMKRYTRQLEQESRKRERLESDMRIGSEIQQKLLPAKLPERPGLEVSAWIQPARDIGGDYYDFAECPDDRLLVALGDASGKGLPAALLITECASVLQAFSTEEHPLDYLLSKTNRLLCDRLGTSGSFVTLFLARFHENERELRYAVAGHNPAFLVRQGGIDPLHCDVGLPLGVSDNAEYRERVVSVAPGDTLVIYSDGVTEAQTPEAGMYGEERLLALLDRERAQSAEALAASVKADVQSHMNGGSIFDDMTLIVVRVNGTD